MIVIYVNKADGTVQESHAPDDIENWEVVEVSNSSSYMGRVLDKASGVFVKDLVHTKGNALEGVNQSFNTELGLLVDAYPQLERDTWTAQEQMAREYLADNTLVLPPLEALALARGVTVDVLANLIVAKADGFKLASLTLVGKRQALEDAINQAATVSEVEALAW